MRKITVKRIDEFREYLKFEEKSISTLNKYIHDVTVFGQWCLDREVDKSLMLEYKQIIIGKYAPASVNAILSSLNRFLEFVGWTDCKVKAVKIQRQIFAAKEKEMTKAEYQRLLRAALDKNNKRLYYLMQTICSTGIRVSELRFITVEAVKAGQATINCKGKMRIVILPKQLCQLLKKYVRERRITSGAVFITKSGKPMDRSNIWSDMKKLCADAGVDKNKVFPHNFRHLFARTYYSAQRDIIRLADILGHSNINTTRIYTMETGEVHRKQIQKLGLLQC
jgi:integrase/recombinase XerD